jgi:hypothetical protein
MMMKSHGVVARRFFLRAAVGSKKPTQPHRHRSSSNLNRHSQIL